MSLQASVRYYSHGSAGVRPIITNRRAVLQPISPTVFHMNRGGKPKTGDDATYGMTANHMRNMVMGTPIPTTLPIGSLHMAGGGKVPAHPGRPPKTVLAEIPTKGVDQVPALLQGGEIVIPKKIAPKVNAMLKAKGIHLPGC